MNNQWLSYRVLQGETGDDLAAKVTQCLREGYSLHGKLKVVGGVFYQAVVRYGQPCYG